VEGGDLTLLHAVAFLAGVALGALQLSPAVARRHGVDLRRVGDRNPGAWNALEHLGPRAAAPAFLLDGAKGLAAGLVGLALAGWWGGWLGVAGAMLGHAFPPQARLRGGKSVMCFVGGAVALAPLAALLSLALCAVVSGLASFAWGARAGVAAFPLVVLAVGPDGRALPLVWLMAIIGALFAIDRLRRRRPGPANAGSAGARRRSA
jgi:glycerol-3-phosphate acyltransferase PlsY